MVLVVTLVTLVLAVQSLTGHDHRTLSYIAGGTVIALVPVLWVSAWRVRRARQRALAAYTASQQRLTAFVGTANEVLWETNSEGIITYVGPRAEMVLGYGPDELVGQGIDLVLAGRDHQRATDLLATSLAGGHGWTGERFTMLTRDGREKEMYSSALIHVSDDGKPVGFTGTLRELTLEAEAVEEYTRLHQSVQAILDNRALRPVYQPIVSLTSGAIIGAEALTRFTADPPLAPDVWFQRASDVGLGTDLELLALSTALESAVHLPKHIYLSVNLSPQALSDERAIRVLEQSSWPCHQLVVEITEHVSVSDYAALAEIVAQLRDLGVRIAVDDAGAGYASFRHILQLRPDYIKLDRALVDGLDHDPAKRALAGAFVAFGKEVDATIIAEGVETGHEVRAARALGMHAAQGFHLSRPAPADRMWGTAIGR
jgi:PAS domain S-box-containing protein